MGAHTFINVLVVNRSSLSGANAGMFVRTRLAVLTSVDSESSHVHYNQTCTIYDRCWRPASSTFIRTVLAVGLRIYAALNVEVSALQCSAAGVVQSASRFGSPIADSTGFSASSSSSLA